VQQLTKEQIKERRKIFGKIQTYIHHFPDRTQDWNIDAIRQIYDMNTLEETYEEIKHAVGSYGSTEAFKQGYYMATSMGETYLCKAGFRVEGVTNLVTQDKTIQDGLVEIGIEQSDKLYTNPMVRVIGNTARLFYMMHYVRSMNANPVVEENKPFPLSETNKKDSEQPAASSSIQTSTDASLTRKYKDV
jgi:hypothetical protein